MGKLSPQKVFFIEVCQEILPYYQEASRDGQSMAWMSLDDLEVKHSRLIQSQAVLFLAEGVKKCLDEDAEGIFANTYITNQPQANFQAIAKLILAGFKWQEISAELGVPIPTLSSFYYRTLKKFAPKFQVYL